MAFLTFFLIFSGGKRKTMNKNFSFEFTKTESGWLDFEIRHSYRRLQWKGTPQNPT